MQQVARSVLIGTDSVDIRPDADNTWVARGDTRSNLSMLGVVRAILPRRKKNLSTFDLIRVTLVVVLAATVLWVAIVVVAVAAHLWPVTLVLLAALTALLYSRRRRRLAGEVKARQAEEEAWEAIRQAWRSLTLDDGVYSVVVSGFADSESEAAVAELLSDIQGFRDRPGEAEAVVERVVHIAPEAVAENVSQRSAVHLKEALELRGAKVKIQERQSVNRGGRREAISAAVRREVWHRDGGRCVDCGSRERLEYDHIIAVANGGSNTARNLELRCEKCNRRKGASI